MKGSVKVAYWDTAQGNPPRLAGEIRGTPSIKFIRPAKKNKPGSNKKKTVLDYNGERKAEAMQNYVESQQPNFLTNIKAGMKDLNKFIEKADQYLLPKAILITRESTTTSIAKALSTEFRRKMLVAEVKATKANKDVIDKFGVTDFGNEKTVVVIIKEQGMDSHVIMSKDDKPAKFSWRAASTYLSKVALDVPYYEKEAYIAMQAAAEGDASKDEPEPDASTPKSEL